MLVASWNVAEWGALLKYIKQHYGSLSAYLHRHHIDLLCLQEVKVTDQKLNTDAAALCAHSVEGWESFWACPKKSAHGGWCYNGVATFARKGLTVSATACALDDHELDGEARCLLTDHGSFVLFNVYAHSTGEDPDGSKFERKLTFLEALRSRVSAMKSAGRHVIVAGDLNIAARGIDVPWRQSMLPVPALLEGAAGKPLRDALGEGGVEQLSAQFGQRERVPVWEVQKLIEPLLAATVKPVEAVVAAPQAQAAAKAPTANDEDGPAPTANGEGGPAPPANIETSAPLSACAPAQAGSAALLVALQREVGRSNSSAPLVSWFERLLSECDLVDSFAEVRPRHVQRATAWSRYTNARFCNNGRRIDYLLVSRALFEEHGRAGGPLAEGEDEDGALRAATAGGRWVPAAFGGGGLPEVSMAVHEMQFARAPHTGIVYTPPHASDHVMVTLLLDDAAIPRPLPVRPMDDATKACSRRPQKTLSAFFGQPAGKAGGSGGGGAKRAKTL